MPRREKVRRFEPRYGVSQEAVEVEAQALGREVEDHELLSPAELDAMCVERYATSKHAWKHLHLLVESLSEQERRVLHSLFFRDMYHLLELYLTYIRVKHPQALAPRPPTSAAAKTAPQSFSEWLFERSARKE